MEKNENINKKSIKSLNEFNENKIKSYIKFHKIFLSIIIIINIILIAFIVVYKSKISKIKLELNDNSSKRYSNYYIEQKNLLRNLVNKKLNKEIIFAI
jgi:cell division protein FtsL